MADGSIIIDTHLDSSGAEKGVKGLGGKLSGIASAGLRAFKGLVVGATAAIGTLGGIGLKFNSDMEQYMVNFETMLGSAEAATKHLNELKEFAAKTPFELGDLADASKTLLAFGTDVEDITPSLKMLGDISLGNKEKFKSLALVFGQVQSQGKLMGQDLNQMINAGFNPLQVISEKTGESMADLKEKMADGQITFDMVTEAMQIATSEGGRFNGAMEKQSQTAAGLFSTLKDNFKTLVGEVFVPLSETIKNDILPTALGYIETLTAAFRENGLSGLASAAQDIILELINKFIEAIPSIVQTGINIITGLITGIGEAMPNFLVTVTDTIMSLCTVVADNLPTIIQSGITLIQGLIEGILSSIPVFVEQAPILVQALVDGLVESIPLLIDAAIKLVDDLIAFITDPANLNNLIKSMITIINSLSDGIIKAIPLLVNAAITLVQKLIAFITTPGNLSNIIRCAITLIAELAKGLLKAIPQLVTSAFELVDSIVDTLLNTNWFSVGVDILSGIAGGLLDNIWGVAQSLGSSLLGAVKGFFGIKSPSRLFAKEIGPYLAQGIGVGFDGELPDVTKKMSLDVSDMISQMNASVAYEHSKSIPLSAITNNYEINNNDNGNLLKAISGINNKIIEVPISIDGREFMRATAQYQDEFHNYYIGR